MVTAGCEAYCMHCAGCPSGHPMQIIGGALAGTSASVVIHTLGRMYRLRGADGALDLLQSVLLGSGIQMRRRR